MLAPGILIRRRIIALLLAFSLAGMVLEGRLLWLQVGRGDWLAKRGAASRLHRIPLQPPRGDIVDRYGRLLVGSYNVESIYAQPALVTDAKQAANLLAQVLELPQDKLLARLTKRSSFEWLARKVDPAKAAKVRTLALPGIGLVPEVQRDYPGGSLAAHALGISGVDAQGLEGLELVYDQYLRGEGGAILLEHDARGKFLADGGKRYNPPVPGLTLVTTLDRDIQHIVEKDAERTIQETRAASVAILVMDVKDGGILGMTMRPTFEPAAFGAAPPQVRRLWVATDGLEPGSIFKPVTAAAALNDGLVTPETTFPDPGCIMVKGWGRPICNYDHRGLGEATVAKIMERSSNVGFLQIGQRVGIERFYKYLERFGMTTPTGIDLPGEASGQRPDPKKATIVDLSVMAFGQTLTVTPLQMVNAIATIANNGARLRPHLLGELRSPTGELVKRYDPQVVTQAVTPETAKTLQTLMERVVAEGTGRNAGFNAKQLGYLVAGKTGTAEMIENGVRAQGKYIASFVGFGPVPDPRIAVLVMIREPQGVYYGGQIAAPVFGRIVPELFDVLEVQPGKPPVTEQVEAPALVNLPVNRARDVARAAGLELTVMGDGPVITEQTPPPGLKLTKGSSVFARALGPVPGAATVTVPDLRTLDLTGAAGRLADLGLVLQPEGDGVCVRQDPAPGARIKAGSQVHVYFEPPPRPAR